MAFVDELEKLVGEQSKLETEVKPNYYDVSLERFKYFYREKLQKNILAPKNARLFLDNLDTVLKYTNAQNSEWLSYSIIIKQPDFVEKLIDNLPNFRFNDYLADLLCDSFIYGLEETNPQIIEDLFNEKLLDYLVSLRLDQAQYAEFASKMNAETQLKFLKRLIDNRLDVQYVNFTFKGNNKAFFEEHVLEAAECSKDLYSLKEVLTGKGAINELNRYIDSHKEQAINSILNHISYLSDVKDESIKNIAFMVIKEVIENEKAKLSDISFTGGGYSVIIFVGNKVVKLGYNRMTKKFANNPYIIQPLLRKQFDSDNDEQIFIEVTEKVDAVSEVTMEEAYELYKNIRNLGLIWTDVAAKNIGRLTKDNVINWNEDLPVSDESLGLDHYRGNTVLKKGDLVVLDADFIYDENDPNIKYPEEIVVEQFEKQYQEEKGKLTDNLPRSNHDTMQYKKGYALTRALSLVLITSLFAFLMLFIAACFQ